MIADALKLLPNVSTTKPLSRLLVLAARANGPGQMPRLNDEAVEQAIGTGPL